MGKRTIFNGHWKNYTQWRSGARYRKFLRTRCYWMLLVGKKEKENVAFFVDDWLCNREHPYIHAKTHKHTQVHWNFFPRERDSWEVAVFLRSMWERENGKSARAWERKSEINIDIYQTKNKTRREKARKRWYFQIVNEETFLLKQRKVKTESSEM